MGYTAVSAGDIWSWFQGLWSQRGVTKFLGQARSPCEFNSLSFVDWHQELKPHRWVLSEWTNFIGTVYQFLMQIAFAGAHLPAVPVLGPLIAASKLQNGWEGQWNLMAKYAEEILAYLEICWQHDAGGTLAAPPLFFCLSSHSQP